MQRQPSPITAAFCDKCGALYRTASNITSSRQAGQGAHLTGRHVDAKRGQLSDGQCAAKAGNGWLFGVGRGIRGASNAELHVARLHVSVYTVSYCGAAVHARFGPGASLAHLQKPIAPPFAVDRPFRAPNRQICPATTLVRASAWHPWPAAPGICQMVPPTVGRATETGLPHQQQSWEAVAIQLHRLEGCASQLTV